jgi:hypothetical protein
MSNSLAPFTPDFGFCVLLINSCIPPLPISSVFRSLYLWNKLYLHLLYLPYNEHNGMAPFLNTPMDTRNTFTDRR